MSYVLNVHINHIDKYQKNAAIATRIIAIILALYVEQIKMIKSNPLVFRKHLNHAFIKVLEPIKAKIAFIDEQINYLKDTLDTTRVGFESR